MAKSVSARRTALKRRLLIIAPIQELLYRGGYTALTEQLTIAIPRRPPTANIASESQDVTIFVLFQMPPSA